MTRIFKNSYGDVARLSEAWNDGWFVDLGCTLWNKWYKRESFAIKYLKACGYTEEITNK